MLLRLQRKATGLLAEVRWALLDSGELRRQLHADSLGLELLQRALDQLDQTCIRSSYASLLRQCSSSRALSDGKLVHAHIVLNGHDQDTFLANLLIQMYGKCGSLGDACLVFSNLAKRNVFSWTLMLAAFAQNGQNREAIILFRRMQQEGTKATSVTLVTIFGACSNMVALAEGKAIHESIFDSGLEFNMFLENSLVNMYGRCGSLDDAKSVFDKMPERDVISWTAIIAAHTQHGHLKEALELFHRMDSEDVKPNEVTFASVLGACCTADDLAEGKMIHSQIVSGGFQGNSAIGTALLIMYIKCGSLDDARSMFDRMQQRDVVCWNALIAAFIHKGDDGEALRLFRRMNCEGQPPNEITFSTALSACSNMGALADGQKIHAQIVATGFESDVVVGNTLVGFYGKCGSLTDARAVFSKMCNREIVSWNAMITVCVQHEHFEEVLVLFKQMDLEGVKPNEITFVGALDACSEMGDLPEGRTLHARIAAQALECHPIVGTALVNLYGKSGRLADARTAFDKLQARDVVTWNSLMAAYSKFGHGKECLLLFHERNLEGMQPNEITFISVLSACSHSGLLHEAWDCFNSMRGDYGMSPLLEHYGCIIDLLGRAGRLDEVESFIKNMDAKPDVAAWISMLSACKIHSQVDRGIYAADQACKLEPENAASHVMLSSIYAAADWPDDVKRVSEAHHGICWIE